jgi:DNA-binding MarR family transcriptional regulator
VSDEASLTAEEWAFWDRWMRAQRLLVREVDRVLQAEFGLSKPEFSILVQLRSARGGVMRVVELADSLDWDKSRVAHMLTRMEKRGLVDRAGSSESGRRTGIALSRAGADLADSAIRTHGQTIRRVALDGLTAREKAAIESWSGRLIQELG